MDKLRGLWELLGPVLDVLSRNAWDLLAQALEPLRGLGGPRTAGLVLLAGLVAWVGAWWLQKRLIRQLRASPGRRVPMWRLELQHSLLAPLAVPIFFLVRAARFLFSLRKRVSERRARRRSPAAEKPPSASPPLVVASLGPSFLLAALITAGLYWLARLFEPLLHAQLGLSAGFSAWQFLLLGHSLALHWLLPLEQDLLLGALLSIFFWLALWWTVGNLLRALVFGRDLGRNLVDARSDHRLLGLWRRWLGVRDLVQPASAYRAWAGWLLAAALPLLLWSWVLVQGAPYRVLPSTFAVAFVVVLAWGIHLTLKGLELLPAAADQRLPVAAAARNGWLDVVADLKAELGLKEPEETAPPRPIVSLETPHRADRASMRDGVLSPLALDLLPAAGAAEGDTAAGAASQAGLTEMQYQVLRSLSLMAYVHLDPPAADGELRLQDRRPGAVEDRSGLRERNQIVLAPEGGGKTTLALLAAANHALVHTAATLIVVHREEQAKATYEQLRQAVDPSTVRWNLRVRRVGGDLINDLTQKILPDLVVASLHQLVVSLLDNTETYAPFLSNVGLIVVDDVESFAGPVEVHAQLAFRRLALRLRELAGVRGPDREIAPLFLVLGAASMHDTPVWARSLCGIDAVARNFGASNGMPGPLAAASAGGGGKEDADPAAVHEAIRRGHHQRVYSLNRFRAHNHHRLGIAHVVESCERLRVPWHYRACGDDRRHLGRSPLLLRNEPIHYTAEVAAAAVVFLEGRWSDVQREIGRLERAGIAFRRSATEPIALVTVIDEDEETSMTGCDPRSSLGRAIASLPNPVLRPPSSRTIHTHLAADLLQHWTEVGDVVETFGNPTAHTLRQMLHGGLLLTEERVDIKPEASEYEEKIYVRAMASAVGHDEQDLWRDEDSDRPLQLAKVTQVELASERAVSVRDRTSLTLLARIDADSAGMVLYPDCVFEDARGRFAVVSRGSSSSASRVRDPDGTRRSRGRHRRSASHQVVEVEPTLLDDLSSPRRRVGVEVLAPLDGAGTPAPGDLPHALFRAEPVLIGEHPFDVGLMSVAVTITPIATFRLAPASCEIRQKRVYREGIRKHYEERPLRTIALAIYPNRESGEAPEPLTFAGARLLAAVMRMLLPSIYRGARTGLEVALRMNLGDEKPKPTADQRLGEKEGFFLFDLHAGGNGTARALYRDGVEILLRLCRLVLREVEDLRRLRLLYDQWGDREEVLRGNGDLAARRRASGGGSVAQEAGSAAASDGAEGEEPASSATPESDDEAARASALEWLNSRLRPEPAAPPESEEDEDAVDDGSEPASEAAPPPAGEPAGSEEATA